MNSLFDDDSIRYRSRSTNTSSDRSERITSELDDDAKCTKGVCELLRSLANQDDTSKQRVLLNSEGDAQLISVDGMDPTIFTLESFNEEKCCAIFRFKSELIDSSSGTTPISGTFYVNCHAIAGVVLIEDKD